MSTQFSRNIILIFLGLILLLLTISIIFMLATSFQSTSGMGMGMMSNMGMHMFSMFIPFWVFLILFIFFLMAAIYMFTQPQSTEVKYSKPIDEMEKKNKVKLDSLYKVLKEDEKRVVDLLINKGGKMLQKDIRWELNMTRVQVHRVLERLEERNIIRRRSVGNTNEVSLADWIMDEIK